MFWCHEVESTLAEFFQSIDKGRMWWYNIIGENRGRILYTLLFGPITTGSILLASNIVFMKRENPEPILTVKIIDEINSMIFWSKY